ncbi:neutral cholesterol ester hydrolase 1 [Engystomops pustulosus]|uniref:neutral cholesterol ester hydrolase 1 n=1 Tax=Engystomops pustulosus TaxID=76066 RepID=UPI003AFAD62D
MRTVPVLLTALAALTAYYVYTPLPGSLAEPWKLLLLDATFRAAQDLSNFGHYIGLSHHLRILNFVSNYFDQLDPYSSARLKVTDTVFDGIEVRIFEPQKELHGSLQLSIIYVHGGGWALGSARTRSYDSLCRKIAEDVDAVVVSIEYRLVPNVHFPEQINDVFTAAKFFLQPEVLAKYSVDPHRIAISGDSAGGNLAAAVCQQLAQDKTITTRVKLQALIYPVLQVLDFSTPSYQQNMNMPILSRFVMIKFWLDYLNGSHTFAHAMLVNNHTSLDVGEAVALRQLLNWNSLLPSSFKKNFKPLMQDLGSPRIVQEVPGLFDPRVSPLIALKETLQKVPKTYMLTCEHDVLRDDGTMYVKRLEEAGVDVTHDHYEDCFHGCMLFASWPTYFSAGAKTRDGYIKWLRENL